MPISYDQILLQPSNNFKTENIRTIHLYYEVWRQKNIDKKNPPAKGVYFSTSLAKHWTTEAPHHLSSPVIIFELCFHE